MKRGRNPTGFCSVCQREDVLTRGMCEKHYRRFQRGQALDAPGRGDRDYQAEFHDAALRWADAEDEDADRLEKEMDKAADRFVDWKRRQLKKAKENNQRAS